MAPSITVKEFSVIIPAFNEEGIIDRTLIETCETLRGHDGEIIVVDDGSTDGTFAQATTFANEHPEVRVLRAPRNSGKGAALRQGTEDAHGALIAFLDADMDLHPRQIWTLYEKMRATGADVVVGSKHLFDSQVASPWHRRILSAFFSWLVKALFDLQLTDTQTGIKLFRAEVLRRAFPRVRVRRYAFDLDLLVAASRFGYRIAEVPVEVSSHRPSAGRIGLRSMLAMLRDLFSIYYRASFWRWLKPGLTTKVWMIVLAVGLFTAGVGMGSLLSRLRVPYALRRAVWYATLPFLPHLWRDLLFLTIGVVVAVIALVNLNKHLMAAFVRPDLGDLSGIYHAHNGPQAADRQTEADWPPDANRGTTP